MAKFKDHGGQEWTISLDAPQIAKLRAEAEINLASLDGKVYDDLAEDPVKLVEVLWVLCSDEASRRSPAIDYVKFAQGLRGDALELACDALVEAITDFFPQRKREMLTAIASKNKKIREIGIQKIMDQINDPKLEERVIAELDGRIERAVNSVLTQSSSATSSPDSSG